MTQTTLSVVIPTVTGRERSLDRAIKSYDETLEHFPYELIIIQDEPNWPTACNKGFLEANGDLIHFTADDLQALPGWWEDVVPWLADHDELPAPRVLNADGTWDNAVDGVDRGTPHFTRIPIMTRNQYERIGPWPEIDYASDVWLSERARTLGIETRMFHSYAFIHYWEQVGRIDTQDRLAHSDQELNRLRSEGLQRCG